MNTEYIKMCRKATEIQELWEPKDGHCYYLTKDLYEPDWGGTLKLKEETSNKDSWGNFVEYSKCFDKGIYYIGSDMGVSQGYCDWETWDEDTVKKYSFWLPRQEDLQKICLDDGRYYVFDVLLDDFCAGWNAPPLGLHESFNEYWLLFTMEMCFNKKWDDEIKEWTSL